MENPTSTTNLVNSCKLIKIVWLIIGSKNGNNGTVRGEPLREGVVLLSSTFKESKVSRE